MASLWKTLLQKLWGVYEPSTKVQPPVDMEACRRVGAVGGGACGDRMGSPHVYHAGHEIDWGGVMDRPENTLPRRSRLSLH